MRTLLSYINEFDMANYVDTLMGNDNINQWLTTSYNNRERRIVSSIMNRIIDDKDIDQWMNNPHASELKLRRILKRKLTGVEIQYMDDIVYKLTEMK